MDLGCVFCTKRLPSSALPSSSPGEQGLYFNYAHLLLPRTSTIDVDSLSGNLLPAGSTLHRSFFLFLSSIAVRPRSSCIENLVVLHFLSHLYVRPKSSCIGNLEQSPFFSCILIRPILSCIEVDSLSIPHICAAEMILQWNLGMVGVSPVHNCTAEIIHASEIGVVPVFPPAYGCVREVCPLGRPARRYYQSDSLVSPHFATRYLSTTELTPAARLP